MTVVMAVSVSVTGDWNLFEPRSKNMSGVWGTSRPGKVVLMFEVKFILRMPDVYWGCYCWHSMARTGWV